MLCRPQFGFHSARVRFRSVSDSDSVSISLFAVRFSVRTLAAPFYMGKKTQEEIHEKVPNFVTHFNIQPSG